MLYPCIQHGRTIIDGEVYSGPAKLRKPCTTVWEALIRWHGSLTVPRHP